jgi:UDP-glucose 4-epimerase
METYGGVVCCWILFVGGENPGKYFENNAAASPAKPMISSNVRLLVFSSSAAVYGVPEGVPIVGYFRAVSSAR